MSGRRVRSDLEKRREAITLTEGNKTIQEPREGEIRLRKAERLDRLTIEEWQIGETRTGREGGRRQVELSTHTLPGLRGRDTPHLHSYVPLC